MNKKILKIFLSTLSIVLFITITRVNADTVYIDPIIKIDTGRVVQGINDPCSGGNIGTNTPPPYNPWLPTGTMYYWDPVLYRDTTANCTFTFNFNLATNTAPEIFVR